MLTKPDAKVLQAIISLGATGAIRQVTEFLEGEQARVRTELEVATGENLTRLQGRAQFLTEFLAMVRDAPATLAKLKASQP